MTFGVTGNWSHALVTSSCCHEIFVAVVSNFNTVFTFFDKKSSHRSRNSHAYLFFFYLPTRLWNSFFAFEVLNRRGTSDSKCREWSVEAKIKSVSMRKPGRTRQGVIMLKSPISLKLGTNVRYQELTYVKECQVQILNSLGDPGSPCKNRHFAHLCIIN